VKEEFKRVYFCHMKLRNHAYNETHVDKLQEVLAPTLHMLWALCVARNIIYN